MNLAPSAAQEESAGTGLHHSLVVGNNTYQHVPSLTKCVSDAEDVDRLLSAKDHTVTLVRNGTKAAMEAALATFTSRLRNGCTAVVYFSGHGLSCQTANSSLPVDSFLVPVDGA